MKNGNQCHVYLLECRDKDKKITYYCGYTTRTLKARLKEHIENVRKKKKKHYTGRQEYVRLAYFEPCKDKKSAMKREKEIKKFGSKYKLGLIHGMKSVLDKAKSKNKKII